MFKKLLSGFLVAILVFSVSSPVFASPSFHLPNEDSGLISITSPIGDDTYIAGGDITIDSDIAGDLFIGGGNIDINANIAGDLFIGGGQISIKGSIGDDVRIGGGQVTLHGDVGDDVFIGGGSVTIADTSTIRGDLLIGAGQFNLYGNVLGNLKASFEDGRIRGTINGNADLRYGDGKLTFADGAKIGGKLDYWTLSENTAFEGIASEMEFHKWTSGKTSVPVMASFMAPFAMITGTLWSFLGLLVIGGVMLLALPKYLPRIVTNVKKSYWTALWQGILIAIVVPIIAMFIAFTGFGIPLSFLIMLSYVSLLIVASIPVSMAIGSYIVKYKEKERGKQFGSLALGGAIYFVLGLLPIIGWIIKLLLFLIGIGIIFMDARLQVKKGNY